jgi:hypothetical protein
MKWKTFYLNKSANVLCFGSFLFFLFGCDINESTIGNEWSGSEEEFMQNFSEIDSEESNQSILLADKFTGKPYTGEIVRTSEGRLTNQNFSNGLLHGKSVKKSDDGSWVEANYLNGKLDGSIKFYQADGTLRSEIEYHNGKLGSSVLN